MLILCHDAGMTESYATQFARKGGEARAKKLSAEERSESARKAVEARWAKQKIELKKLTEEITEGTKALLAKTRKRQAAMARMKKTRERKKKALL
jgi:beta-phosphoglucomutase-like phosphatase (HAD superfamily)